MLQSQIHVMRPATTAHLAQTMTLLSLGVDELDETIQKELASNPALELIEDRRCPVCHKLLPSQGPCSTCSTPQSLTPDEPVVFISPRDDFIPHKDVSEEDQMDESIATVEDDLPTYVMRQIAMELDPKDRKLAAYLLTHLDEDGLLTIPLMEAALYFHISVLEVSRVQRMIQHADPVGVGSVTTQDALKVQLEVLQENAYVPDIAMKAVTEAMDLLCRRQHSELAHKLGITITESQNLIHWIGENLNPYPARSHWGDTRDPGLDVKEVYRQPDILINYLNDNQQSALVVEVILPIRGTLQVNQLFKQAVRQTEPETRDEMKGDLDRATLFVKCLQQRNHTMLRMMRTIVRRQREFIVHGELDLKPLTRAEISRDLEVHESTISRAVANKTVQLPNKRIIPMAMFFDRSLNIRTMVKDMIDSEKRPLSDTDIVSMLAKTGIIVARRTVAKYRSMEGILPAHLRQAQL